MATLTQRLERGVKTTSTRFLRLNASFKRRFGRRAHCLFVTTMPRSGSTFLTRCLTELTGFMPFFLGYHHHNEQDLYLPKLIDSYTMDIVAHHHTRATEQNLALMREFAIEPVILVRRLPDALVSLCDQVSPPGARSPVFDPPEGFRALSYEQRLAVVCDMALPWYVQFYAGWEEATRLGMRTLWLTYEEMVADPVATFRRIFDFKGLPCPTADRIMTVVQAGRQRGDVRFNVGRAGRGVENLTPRQIGAMRDLLDHCRVMLPSTPHLAAIAPELAAPEPARATETARPLKRLGG